MVCLIIEDVSLEVMKYDSIQQNITQTFAPYHCNTSIQTFIRAHNLPLFLSILFTPHFFASERHQPDICSFHCLNTSIQTSFVSAIHSNIHDLICVSVEFITSTLKMTVHQNKHHWITIDSWTV